MILFSLKCVDMQKRVYLQLIIELGITTSQVQMKTGISPSFPDSLTFRAVSSAATYMDDFENIIANGKEPVMTKEYKPQVANEFERYLNPQSLKRHVFRSEKVRKIIEHYAQANNCPVKQIEKQVKDIIDEIGLERNLAIVRWCGMAITAIAKRILSGIYVNASSIRRVREQLGRNPVCYLPSHRSYMDFVLMSYICFYYDIEIPGIAAGMGEWRCHCWLITYLY